MNTIISSLKWCRKQQYCLLWDNAVQYDPKYYLVWVTVPKILSSLGWYSTQNLSGLRSYSTQNTVWFGMIQYPNYCLVWDDTVPKILFGFRWYGTQTTVWFGIQYQNTVYFRMIQYPKILFGFRWYSTQTTVWFGIKYQKYCLVRDDTVRQNTVWFRMIQNPN